MNPVLFANGCLAVTVLVWGTPIPLFDILLERWHPLMLALLRYLCALPFLLVLLWASEPALRRGWRLRPPGVSWLRLYLLGGFGLCGFALLFFFGLALSDPVTVIVLVAASPLVASLVAWALHRTPPARGLGLALVLVIAGALLTRLDLRGLALGEASLEFQGGEPLILLATACWAWYSITAQRWMPGCSQVQLTSATVVPATVVMLVLTPGLILLGLPVERPASPSLGDLGLILWLGISTVGVGIVTWNTGVRALGVVVASMYLNLVPLVAVLTAALLGTEPRIEQLAGGLIVIAGVLQAQLRAAAERKRAAAAGGQPV